MVAYDLIYNDSLRFRPYIKSGNDSHFDGESSLFKPDYRLIGTHDNMSFEMVFLDNEDQSLGLIGVIKADNALQSKTHSTINPFKNQVGYLTAHIPFNSESTNTLMRANVQLPGDKVKTFKFDTIGNLYSPETRLVQRIDDLSIDNFLPTDAEVRFAMFSANLALELIRMYHNVGS